MFECRLRSVFEQRSWEMKCWQTLFLIIHCILALAIIVLVLAAWQGADDMGAAGGGFNRRCSGHLRAANFCFPPDLCRPFRPLALLAPCCPQKVVG
jgi:hypothetical protein